MIEKSPKSPMVLLLILKYRDSFFKRFPEHSEQGDSMMR